MSRYIHREVAAVRDDPTEGEQIRLLLGISGSTSDVIERVERLQGEVVDNLPFDSLVVRLPEERVAELCEIAAVESVELDEGMETLTGN